MSEDALRPELFKTLLYTLYKLYIIFNKTQSLFSLVKPKQTLLQYYRSMLVNLSLITGNCLALLCLLLPAAPSTVLTQPLPQTAGAEATPGSKARILQQQPVKNWVLLLLVRRDRHKEAFWRLKVPPLKIFSMSEVACRSFPSSRGLLSTCPFSALFLQHFSNR